MPPSRTHIHDTALTYLTHHPDERPALAPLFTALAAPDDPTHRTTLPAHVTCSAVVIDHDTRILHVHHRATGKHLTPGGHIEPTDTTLTAAALRELHEETGLPPTTVTPFLELDGIPLDIDVHTIDANPAKAEPQHLHIDFRYAFRLTAPHPIVLQADEVTGHQWRSLSRVPAPSLRIKLARLAFQQRRS
ncbi:NUDIX hydrolase [Streptomyces niveiscabiei]|uniref:NUDIX hydrolase n=1 Tax=Streptomyces niveiscabiei TaxID=164115 RepID=A0ABW9I646_9ACTN